LLGLGPADVPSRNNKLVRTLARAEQFGLAFTSLGVPGEQLTFGIHGHVALVPARLLTGCPRSPGSGKWPPWRPPTGP
jgi:hypothetical protein